MREQEERGTLVESLGVGSVADRKHKWRDAHVAIMIYQGASSTSEVIFLEDGDFKAGLYKTSCCCNAANASTWETLDQSRIDYQALGDEHTYNDCSLLAGLLAHDNFRTRDR